MLYVVVAMHPYLPGDMLQESPKEWDDETQQWIVNCPLF